MWAWGISQIVGTRDRPLHAVLNMSGTPFRSDESERINTIRYMQTPDGRIDVDPDFTVDAGLPTTQKCTYKPSTSERKRPRAAQSGRWTWTATASSSPASAPR
jgi:hypothetical protein